MPNPIPGKLNYASSGIGTPPHLAGELFKSMAGVDIVHVPFREANSGLNAVIGGNVQMMFSIASTTQSQIAGGTVRGLGVTTLEPTPLVPGVPAIAQSGLPGFEVIGWNGLVAPAGTPAPIIAKLNAAFRRGSRRKTRASGWKPRDTTLRRPTRRRSLPSSSGPIRSDGSMSSRRPTSA